MGQGLDGVAICCGACGVVARLSGLYPPGVLALLIAVQTRSARAGSYAIARAACTNSLVVSP